MDKVIQVAEASRQFSELVREVQEGQSFVVTSDGHPVARIVPVDAREAERLQGWRELIVWLKEQPATNVGPWTRDELYDD